MIDPTPVPTTAREGKLRRLASEMKSPTSFFGHVLVLVGWTAIAQALYVVTLPIISRLYPVEAFGHLSVLQSVSAFIIVISAMRYEVAVLLPEDDESAINILALSMLAVIATSILVAGVGLALPLASLFRGQFAFLASYWWLIPVTQFGAGGREALQYWAIRRKSFTTIAHTKVTQVAAQLGSQLGFGLAGFGPVGLYVGDVLGRTGGTTALLRLIWVRDKSLIKHISLRRMFRLAQDYKSFPLFSIWAVLLSTACRNCFPIVIAGLYGATSAGWYALASRVIAAPLELICRSFSQVYMGEAAELCRTNPLGLRRLFLISARKLFLYASIPSLALFILGPLVFGFVFGDKWTGAGVYARCMSIMLLTQFVNFPLVHTLNILEKQSWQLIWDACTLLIGTGGVILVHHLGASDTQAVIWWSASMSAMFAVHFVITTIAINRRISDSRLSIT